jgi:GNAT superfamily N-acetyltransferase
MTEEDIVRRRAPTDLDGIRLLVTQALAECYGHLIPDVRADPGESWEHAWVVERRGRIIGVMMTAGDWLDDLWIARSARSAGLGGRLLSIAEREIVERGHPLARLRVVAENTNALGFYAHHGWRLDRRYPHERHGFEMVEMVKAVSAERPSD